MGEDYLPSKSQDKEKRYQHVMESFKAVSDAESHPISNLCNFLALLKQEFNWLWIGFYFVSQKAKVNMLILGPFQGPLACTMIRKGKGVCGVSWEKGETLIVQDVQKFQGHISCSSESKSQIVIPIFCEKKCVGVLDVDSQKYGEFCQEDNKFISEMLQVLASNGTWKWTQENI